MVQTPSEQQSQDNHCSSLPPGRDGSFFQSPQFETFDKHADGEAFLGHGSLDTHEVNQPGKKGD